MKAVTQKKGLMPLLSRKTLGHKSCDTICEMRPFIDALHMRRCLKFENMILAAHDHSQSGRWVAWNAWILLGM